MDGNSGAARDRDSLFLAGGVADVDRRVFGAFFGNGDDLGFCCYVRILAKSIKGTYRWKHPESFVEDTKGKFESDKREMNSQGTCAIE